ncbi:importin alpha subunit [Mycena metata]|uniref:Importin alpha subunit n=1 Tax=Mycena metata TaxID=1033252 RepID=A0AAD7N959_9AGAR|nr:importin alpha subunit [Mycena metata]
MAKYFLFNFLSMCSTCVSLTWNLCADACPGVSNPADWKLAAALHIPVKLLYCVDPDVIIFACRTISALLSLGFDDNDIQVVIETGICRRLVDLLSHPSEAVQLGALRCVGDIATGDDLQTNVLLVVGVLRALLPLLSSSSAEICRTACWTVSNITAGTPRQVQAVIDYHLVGPMVHLLSTADFQTKKQACWAISNATSGGSKEPGQIEDLVSRGSIQPLCDMLAAADNTVVGVALDGLANIMDGGEVDKISVGSVGDNRYVLLVEASGGLSRLRDLQRSENFDIRMKACDILAQYFSDDFTDFLD